MFELENAESAANPPLKDNASAKTVLKSIMDRLQHFKFSENRRISEKYCELVMFNQDTEKCHKILAGCLGNPVKAAGELTTDDFLDLTHDFGEIVDHQTLFKKDCEDDFIIAMLWPWQDNEHTTLIMAISSR